jgi:hypothetical protein
VKRIPLTFSDLTNAITSLTGAAKQIAGIDMWRQRQGPGTETLGGIDAELAKEVPYAPSKHVGNPDSLWSRLHFHIMMPRFRRMQSVVDNPVLTGWRLSDKEASRYFRFIKDLKQHVQTYHEMASAIDEVIKHLPAQDNQLVAVMQATANKPQLRGTQAADFLRALAEYLPAKPTALFGTLKVLRDQSKPSLRNYGSCFSSVFETLPERSQLGPVFSSLLKDASRQQASDGTLRSGNQLIGRMLQTYYADKRNIPFDRMGLDVRAKAYFKGGKGAFERTLDYVRELSNCPIRPGSDGKAGEVSASDILSLFSTWYLKPSVVEMVTPEYTGAAAEAAERFKLFLDDVKIKTGGIIDLAGEIEADDWTSMRGDDVMLRRIGRMAMAMDASGNKPGAPLRMDSAILVTFAKTVWPAMQRKEVWASTERYVPNLERGFEQFRQDVATLLFATALNVAYHAVCLPGQAEERLAHIATLKQLAWDIKTVDTINALISVLGTPESKSALSYIKDDAIFLEHNPQFHCPNAASGMHFISTYFGLEAPAPVPIPEAEIKKGLTLQLLKRAGKLLVGYQEAGSKIQCDVTVSSTAAPPITYHEQAVKDGDGIVYPAYISLRREGRSILIPVIGRTSYDPMGTSCSAHAGEVIGFGCSMHHGSLQYALTMAAALGADRSGLNTLKGSFMAVNPQWRQREALAGFQVDQVVSAFETGKAVTYREWINQHGLAAATSSGHEHTQVFLLKGGYPPSYREACASLAMSYPELYPADHQMARTLSPRESFYYERDVSTARQKTSDNARTFRKVQSCFSKPLPRQDKICRAVLSSANGSAA